MNKEPIEIYFDDLKEETQQAILELLGDNGNYDVIPIAEIYPYEDEDNDDDYEW